MRKDAKKEKAARTSAISGYHHGRHETNKLFTSDRYEVLDASYMRTSGKPYKGYGLEIETECFAGINDTQYADLLDNMVLNEFPKDLFKKEHDASLHGGSASAELVTQVMTKEFIRNHYAAFKYMYDNKFKTWNISCAQTGNCGMHVNISNACFGTTKETQDKAIRKLYYIINHHFDLMCVMLMRDRNRTSYCSRMECAKSYCKTMDLDGRCSNHGISFNLGHYSEGQGRIELRLVGGQRSYAAFRNTMETVFHLVDAVKNLSWEDCDDAVKIFAGCNQYVYDRLTLAMRAGLISGEQAAIVSSAVKEASYL